MGGLDHLEKKTVSEPLGYAGTSGDENYQDAQLGGGGSNPWDVQAGRAQEPWDTRTGELRSLQ